MKSPQVKYEHSLSGVITRLYCGQKSSSKKRGHPAPNYTKEDLRTWLDKYTDITKQFNNWKDSSFNPKLKPSIDRVDRTKPYTLSNIRLVPWIQNNIKGRFERSIPISQWKNDTCLACYPSIKAASMAHIGKIGFSTINITRALNKGGKTSAGGFQWKAAAECNWFNMKQYTESTPFNKENLTANIKRKQ